MAVPDTSGAGFGPFDLHVPIGLTEYGGGSGLVEGSPMAQSSTASVLGIDPATGLVVVHVAPGSDHVLSVADTMSVDEKLGVDYRAARALAEASFALGDAGAGTTAVDPETGMSTDDVVG